MVTVVVEGQTLKVERIIEGDSGKVTVVLVSGQQIVYRPPAANVIRDALKPKEKSERKR